MIADWGLQTADWKPTKLFPLVKSSIILRVNNPMIADAIALCVISGPDDIFAFASTDTCPFAVLAMKNSVDLHSPAFFSRQFGCINIFHSENLFYKDNR